MPRVQVAADETEIAVFTGRDSKSYRVKNGEVVVDDAHVGAVLASLPGSRLVTETPSKER